MGLLSYFCVMKLYRKILRLLFIGITLWMFFYFMYTSIIRDLARGYPVKKPSEFEVIVLVLFFSFGFCHFKFYTFYKEKATWLSLKQIETIPIYVNYVISGLGFVVVLILIFQFVNERTIIGLFYCGYSLFEGIQVHNYLKRNRSRELESSIHDIGKE